MAEWENNQNSSSTQSNDKYMRKEIKRNTIIKANEIRFWAKFSLSVNLKLEVLHEK